MRHAIEAAAPAETPFAHLVIDEFLPTGIFADTFAALERLADFERPEPNCGSAAPRAERAIFQLSAYLRSNPQSETMDTLGVVNQALLSPTVVNACLAAFSDVTIDDDVAAQPRSQVILSRDYPPYAIGPHTDVPKRLTSMILYVAPNDAPAEWGTSLFVPKHPGFTCSRGQHYDFGDFMPSSTVAFRANRALLFARSDRSFHGLLPIEPDQGPRETLLYEIVRSP